MATLWRWLFLLVLVINGGSCWKMAFWPEDILPALPHYLSWPVLNTLHNAADLLPEFVAAVSPSSNVSTWKGACFYENQAWMKITNSSGNTTGGILHIVNNKAHSWSCMDLYVFATPFRISWDFYFVARNHSFTIDKWEEGELEYVKQKGISIFLMKSGMLGTLTALWDVLPLFSNTGWGQNANIDFLERRMGAKFTKRFPPHITNVSIEDIHSGDFLVLSKLRGRWGGFETLEKWVTGAYAGHTAVCLRDEDGRLLVGESGHENAKGEEIIVLMSWEDWWSAQLKDDSNPQVALLPLHPKLRAKFNQTTALIYARQRDGNPYGYHNMIFSWIDTPLDNYPPPLDANLVASVMTVWTRLQPDYAANMWNEALNKRLGTKGLDLPSIIWEAEQRGIPFEILLTIPEQDDWVYHDGKSTSCVAFVLGMYKEAGLFGVLTNDIHVTEFTIRDAYMLKFFEDNRSRLPSWCHETDEPSFPYCQILGDYRLELPGYNTLEPYAHMDEGCPSLPPDYYRPDHC